MGLSRPLFVILFSFLWFIGTIQLIYSQCLNDRKQERRRKSSMLHFLWPVLFRDSLTPCANRLIAFPKKSQVRPKIWTRLARTKCHHSTAWATTTARLYSELIVQEQKWNSSQLRSPQFAEVSFFMKLTDNFQVSFTDRWVGSVGIKNDLIFFPNDSEMPPSGKLDLIDRRLLLDEPLRFELLLRTSPIF